MIIITFFAIIATSSGIFSHQGEGASSYKTIRSEEIELYGIGPYTHMSSDVAIQGIAQDIITLFLALPALLLSFIFSLRGSIRAQLISTGTLVYLLVTYLFYLTMGTYNYLFLIYCVLLFSCFMAVSLSLLSLYHQRFHTRFDNRLPYRFCGSFLVVNSIMIGMLWLSIIVPPLIDGSIYPDALDHYTTLIVQGMDLGLLLPFGILCGILLIRRNPKGYLLASVYMVFLTYLMAALIGKLIAMGLHGVSIIPAIFIIPVIEAFAVYCSVRILCALK